MKDGASSIFVSFGFQHTLLPQVHEELVSAIRDAEEGLFHLKRARLLREVDSVVHKSDSVVEDVKVESLDPNDVEAEPLEEQRYSIGSKCRFRHSDGRWYNGQIVGLEGSQLAKMSFLTPTTENMLVSAAFFLFSPIAISIGLCMTFISAKSIWDK